MYKMVNGQLTEMTAEEVREKEAEEALEASKDRRPLAMGRDMLALAQDAFESRDGVLRLILLQFFENLAMPLDDVIALPELSSEAKAIIPQIAKAQGNGTVKFNLPSFLTSTTCNPMSESDFAKVLKILDLMPPELDAIKEPYKQLALQWASSVRFKPEPENTGTDKAEPPPQEIQQLVKSGNCPTPQSLDKRGRKCGKRAANIKG